MKEKKLKEKLKKDKEQQAYSIDLKTAKQYGLESLEPVKKKKKELAKNIVEAIEPIHEPPPLLTQGGGGNKRWRVDEKQFALMFLEVFQDENDITGEFIPKYTTVSKWLGIPRQTLTRWWKDREEIRAQHSTLMEQGLNYATSAMMVELIRMMQSLAKVDYDDFFESPKGVNNFIGLMSMMINKVRLMQNMSTNNVAHEHRHRGGVQMILPDEENNV